MRGIFFLVCSHGSTLPGALVVIANGESMAYYDLLATKYLSRFTPEELVKIKSIMLYYDIACGYSRHARKYKIFGDLQDKINFLIRKFHLWAHGRPCREANNPQYTLGNGNDHGENCEQLNAHIGLFSNILKTMTSSKRWTLLEDIFYFLFNRTQGNLVYVLEESILVANNKVELLRFGRSQEYEESDEEMNTFCAFYKIQRQNTQRTARSNDVHLEELYQKIEIIQTEVNYNFYLIDQRNVIR
jgi:hypothetical protein